jgi:hypothetical protein
MDLDLLGRVIRTNLALNETRLPFKKCLSWELCPPVDGHGSFSMFQRCFFLNILWAQWIVHMKPAITHTQHQKMPTIVPHLTYRRYPAFVLSWVWHVLMILVWLKLLTQVYSSTVLPNVVPPTPSPRISNRELLVHPVTPNNIATNVGIRVCSAQKYILYNLYNVRYFPQIPTMDLGENQLNHLTWMCIQVTKWFFPIHITYEII